MYTYTISVRDLHLHGFHGLFEEEHRRGNIFVWNVEVELQSLDILPKAQLKNTVDYALICNEIEQINTKRVELLEELLAQAVAQIRAMSSQIARVYVSVEKQHPPIAQKIAGVGVDLMWERS